MTIACKISCSPTTRCFIFNFLINSLIFIENKCLSNAIWDLKRVDSVKTHTPNHLHHWNWCLMNVFFQSDYPNHTLVGRVSVNGLCQQGGLFAPSVNRHSGKNIYLNAQILEVTLNTTSSKCVNIQSCETCHKQIAQYKTEGSLLALMAPQFNIHRTFQFNKRFL